MLRTEFGNAGVILGHYSFRYFFCPILSPVSFWNSIYTRGVVPLVTETPCIYSFLSFFTLFFSLDHFYYLSSSLLIFSSTVCYLLLILSKICFMSGTLLFGPRIYLDLFL